MFFCFTFWPL